MLAPFAAHVFAVDRELDHYSYGKDLPQHPNLSYVQSNFRLYRPTLNRNDVAFISWPVPYDSAELTELERLFKTVIYLGKNTDGLSCGSASFWYDMICRPVLGAIEHRENSLIIYGRPETNWPPAGVALAEEIWDRDMLHEEWSATENQNAHKFYDCGCEFYTR